MSVTTDMSPYTAYMIVIGFVGNSDIYGINTYIAVASGEGHTGRIQALQTHSTAPSVTITNGYKLTVTIPSGIWCTIAISQL